MATYKEQLKEEMEAQKTLFEAAKRRYDELIQGKSGSRMWTNGNSTSAARKATY
jgi:hypothetical protein